MTTIFKTIFKCDFCAQETEAPDRWFKIVSAPKRYGTQKAGKIMDRGEVDAHACDTCGLVAHKVLLTLGIAHEFVAIRTDQEPFLWGEMYIP